MEDSVDAVWDFFARAEVRGVMLFGRGKAFVCNHVSD